MIISSWNVNSVRARINNIIDYLKTSNPDILLIPLVAYDNSLNRLGYGGGFYDRYIEKIEKVKKVIKIGLAYSFQKITSVPINEYDKKLDFIITEKDILKWEYYF